MLLSLLLQNYSWQPGKPEGNDLIYAPYPLFLSIFQALLPSFTPLLLFPTKGEKRWCMVTNLQMAPGELAS